MDSLLLQQTLKSEHWPDLCCLLVSWQDRSQTKRSQLAEAQSALLQEAHGWVYSIHTVGCIPFCKAFTSIRIEGWGNGLMHRWMNRMVDGWWVSEQKVAWTCGSCKTSILCPWRQVHIFLSGTFKTSLHANSQEHPSGKAANNAVTWFIINSSTTNHKQVSSLPSLSALFSSRAVHLPSGVAVRHQRNMSRETIWPCTDKKNEWVEL